MRPTSYTPGDWLAACFRCGATQLASTMRKQWQGYYVCANHWEPRHPQDFVRGSADVQTVPWAQPQTDIYIEFCSVNSKLAIPDYAVGGCMLPGYDSPVI
jgi:hypothetical protein